MSFLIEARPFVHRLLHAVVPLAVALIWFRSHWRRAWLWMLAGWLIDIDHLWADPIYVPDRCSLGFHPLHTAPAALVYGLLTAWPRTRLLGLGLLIHLGLDGIDCLLMRLQLAHY
jgi:hypothetical protein